MQAHDNPTSICPVCQQSFILTEHRRRYCSEACRTAKTYYVCEQCGVTFARPPSAKRRFCSAACMGIASRSRVRDEFWAYVEKGDGCWEWTGYRAPSGYGTFNEGRKHYLTHRVAWELTNGPIPDGIQVCHRCDNPPCVRPDHLFLGTTQDNTADRHAKGRSARGHRTGHAKLSESDVRDIRRALENGASNKELAGRYHVQWYTIDCIAKRLTWAWLE